MNEHANLKKIFWVLLACIVVIFVTLSITGRENQMVLESNNLENTSNSSDEKALNSPSEQEQQDDEAWAKKQQDDYLANAKQNPVYVIKGEVVSVSGSTFDILVNENPYSPVSGKQTISDANNTASIERATCTTSGGDIPRKSCSTETISLSDLKNGESVLVSLDEAIFKKDGTLVAKAILVQ